MATQLLTCGICNGKLEVMEEGKTAICQYCGETIRIPTLDNRLIQQLNRGVFLRQKSEFDNALRVYQMIAAEFPDEPEAYWGIVLSRYGITFVDEHGEKKPTLHRMQYQSVLMDPDYLKALQCAKEDGKVLYEEKALAIDSISKKYHTIVNHEAPYDVFICYKDKEIHAPGKPTMDRVYAQEIYTALTERGYKVFFSHISLEKHPGIEYEPYIFAALNSAAVMLVVGTSKENLESAWVKNEWSRFLEITRLNSDKKLIPVFRDMDPYDLPKEFVSMSIQGINYASLGAVYTICDKVSAIMKMPSDTKAKIEKMLVVAQADLKNGLKEEARRQYEQILRIDGTNYKVPLQLLLMDYHLSSEQELPSYDRALIEENEYWPAVMSRANEEQRLILEEYRRGNRAAFQFRVNTEVLEQIRNWLSALNTNAPIYPAQYKNPIIQLLKIVDFQNAAELLESTLKTILKSINVYNLKPIFRSWRGYLNEEYREACQHRKQYYAVLRIFLNDCLENPNILSGIRLLEDAIRECRDWEHRIEKWLEIGEALTHRVIIKKCVYALLASLSVIVGYIYISNPVMVAILVPVTMFLLLSLHQVEASPSNTVLRAIICLPLAFCAWRIALAHSLFSFILRMIIWGGAGGFLLIAGAEFLFEREEYDIDKAFENL